jgi:3-oxoacyl-[acyl-carrier protein] reductase
MTRSLARVFAPDVRVNAVCPGFVQTRFAGWPPEAFEKAKGVTPLRRLATVEEVARAVLYFAADATGTTGDTVVIDGGVFHLGRSR